MKERERRKEKGGEREGRRSQSGRGGGGAWPGRGKRNLTAT